MDHFFVDSTVTAQLVSSFLDTNDILKLHSLRAPSTRKNRTETRATSSYPNRWIEDVSAVSEEWKDLKSHIRTTHGDDNVSGDGSDAGPAVQSPNPRSPASMSPASMSPANMSPASMSPASLSPNSELERAMFQHLELNGDIRDLPRDESERFFRNASFVRTLHVASSFFDHSKAKNPSLTARPEFNKDHAKPRPPGESPKDRHAYSRETAEALRLDVSTTDGAPPTPHSPCRSPNLDEANLQEANGSLASRQGSSDASPGTGTDEAESEAALARATPLTFEVISPGELAHNDQSSPDLQSQSVRTDLEETEDSGIGRSPEALSSPPHCRNPPDASPSSTRGSSSPVSPCVMRVLSSGDDSTPSPMSDLEAQAEVPAEVLAGAAAEAAAGAAAETPTANADEEDTADPQFITSESTVSHALPRSVSRNQVRHSEVVSLEAERRESSDSSEGIPMEEIQDLIQDTQANHTFSVSEDRDLVRRHGIEGSDGEPAGWPPHVIYESEEQRNYLEEGLSAADLDPTIAAGSGVDVDPPTRAGIDFALNQLAVVIGLIYRNIRTLEKLHIEGPRIRYSTGYYDDSVVDTSNVVNLIKSHGFRVQHTVSRTPHTDKSPCIFPSLREVRFGRSFDLKLAVMFLAPEVNSLPELRLVQIGELVVHLEEEDEAALKAFVSSPLTVCAPHHILLAKPVPRAAHLPAIYKGAYENSRFSGKGWYSSYLFSYAGGFLKGVNHGFGVMRSRSGEGPRLNGGGGGRLGKDGRLVGEEYVGQWRFGQRFGTGRCTQRSGDILTGLWENDYLNGLGTLKTGDLEYHGGWLSSRPDGFGVFIYKKCVLLAYGLFRSGFFHRWSRAIRYEPLCGLVFEEAEHSDNGTPVRCFQLQLVLPPQETEVVPSGGDKILVSGDRRIIKGFSLPSVAANSAASNHGLGQCRQCRSLPCLCYGGESSPNEIPQPSPTFIGSLSARSNQSQASSLHVFDPESPPVGGRESVDASARAAPGPAETTHENDSGVTSAGNFHLRLAPALHQITAAIKASEAACGGDKEKVNKLWREFNEWNCRYFGRLHCDWLKLPSERSTDGGNLPPQSPLAMPLAEDCPDWFRSRIRDTFSTPFPTTG